MIIESGDGGTMEERKVCRCERCGWVWMARTGEAPTRCANQACRSPYWDRPRKQPKEA